MSVVAKTGKTRRKPESATETLDQLESLGDRVGNWIAENAVFLLAGAALILVLAGGYGFVSSRQDEARQEASAALAQVEGAYLRDMGSHISPQYALGSGYACSHISCPHGHSLSTCGSRSAWPPCYCPSVTYLGVLQVLAVTFWASCVIT